MSAASDYWHLQQLAPSGHCRRHLLNSAQTWLQQQDITLPQTEDDGDRPLQSYLLTLWQQAPDDGVLALLCLRCFVSHPIRQACLQLVKQFGKHYQFQGSDLFCLVLNDDGKPLSGYLPLSVHIVETYVPGKASLRNWASHLTRNHQDLNQFLLQQGLYRVSDWAILNDTAPSQLPQILGEFHTLTSAEIKAAQELLERYHQVYRRQRFQNLVGRKRGRCQVPSDRQLHDIDDTVSPQIVLGRLRQLAYWLRQYRIDARGGTPLVDSLDELDDSMFVAREPDLEPTEQDTFLSTYRDQFHQSLAEAMTETLSAYCDRLGSCKKPKDQTFLKALCLFHCQGLTMTAIAPHVGLTTQVQVSRLMNLRQFRADVRNALLSRLQHRVRDGLLQIKTMEQLREMGDRLDAALADETDRLMAEAESETRMPHNRTTRSLFARHLCQSLRQFIDDCEHGTDSIDSAPISPSNSHHGYTSTPANQLRATDNQVPSGLIADRS